MAIFNMVGGSEWDTPIEIYDYLCFTANTSGSTVKLNKWSSITGVITLETSTDWTNWSTYTFWNTITLTNIWDKVYWRNTSTTDTTFSESANWSAYWYVFAMTGSISASGDVNYLLNKNSTRTLSNYCFHHLFDGCTALTTAPDLYANTLPQICYASMFKGCTNLTTPPRLDIITSANSSNCLDHMFQNCTSLNKLPKLFITAFWWASCNGMFQGCTNIKLSTTQTGEYQTAYRIPISWTCTTSSNSFLNMFNGTGWTFTWTPSLNTTYYTSNEVIW